MATQNTYPCRGCGKPFLEDGPRKAHESSCPLADDPEEREQQEAEPDVDPDPPARAAEVQESPAAPVDPHPEPQGEHPEEPDPQPRIAADRVCGCCGSDPGSLSRNGMCYGCELAGCDPDSLGCDHLPGGG